MTCRMCRYFVCTLDPGPGLFGSCCVEPIATTRLADAPMCRHGMPKPIEETTYGCTSGITTTIEE